MIANGYINTFKNEVNFQRIGPALANRWQADHITVQLIWNDIVNPSPTTVNHFCYNIRINLLWRTPKGTAKKGLLKVQKLSRNCKNSEIKLK